MKSEHLSALIIVENSYPPLDVRVWNEATALRDAGWKVSIICPAPKRTSEESEKLSSFEGFQELDEVSLYRFPLTFAERGIAAFIREYLSAFISIARLSWKVWKKNPFDIIHFCNPPDIFFPIALFFRLLGARVIFDHHDLLPEAISSRYRGFTRRFLYLSARITEFLTFRAANVVISTNDSYRQVALERGGLNYSRVITVRNGPKLEEFTPVQPNPTLKRGFSYLACYVGVMGHEDGIDELISSIKFVVHDLKRRDIGFVLIGDGSARAKAYAEIQSWKMNSYVQMPGMILDRDILNEYLSTADICLAPEPLNPLNAKSTFIKIGEYMAMGKPIIAFSLDETRFTAGQAAAYVEPGNIEEFARTMVNLLDDPDKREFMGRMGRSRILDRFAWDHQTKNLLLAYELALMRKQNPDKGTMTGKFIQATPAKYRNKSDK